MFIYTLRIFTTLNGSSVISLGEVLKVLCTNLHQCVTLTEKASYRTLIRKLQSFNYPINLKELLKNSPHPKSVQYEFKAALMPKGGLHYYNNHS